MRAPAALWCLAATTISMLIGAAGQTPPIHRWLPAAQALPGRAAAWSYAGYRDGDVPLPNQEATYNVVKSFGAKGNGVADDTAAVQAAIAAASRQPGVVLLPAGIYRISMPLTIAASGVVLRGAGEAATRIIVAKPLADVFPGSWSKDNTGKIKSQWLYRGGFIQFTGAPVTSGRTDTLLGRVAGAVAAGSSRIPVNTTLGVVAGQWVRLFAVKGTQELQVSARVAALGDGWLDLDRPVPLAVGGSSGWTGSLHRYAATVQEGGVEKLTVQIEAPPRYGAHASDRGYNAIYLSSASHIWVQQVTVLNADNALLLERVDHATLQDITVGTAVPRWAAADATWQREGHHAIALSACQAVLVTRFSITSRYYHDLASTDGSLLNVFTGGSALDLNLHHAGAPLANLYSDLDAGQGSRLFVSVGGSAPGALTTFWNLRAAATVEQPLPTPTPAPTPPQPSPSPSPPPPSPLLPSPPPSPKTGCGTTDNGTDLWGADLAEVTGKSALADCFPVCATTVGCGAFTYVKQWKTCYLKKGAGWTRKTLAGAQSVVVRPCAASLVRRTLKGPAAQPGAAAPQLASIGRRLAAAASLQRVLPLPACTYGKNLAFVGSFSGKQCTGWLVQPLGANLPADLYAQQWFDRGNAPPIPAGAHRPVAATATEACRTWMGDPQDPLECWHLVYDHCIPGYTSRNWMPKDISYNEKRVLASLFNTAAKDGSFGKPPTLPAQYSRLCVANPELAGTGACSKVKPGDFRIHTLGFRPSGWARCDHISGQISFVKAHVDGQFSVGVWGRVGH